MALRWVNKIIALIAFSFKCHWNFTLIGKMAMYSPWFKYQAPGKHQTITYWWLTLLKPTYYVTFVLIHEMIKNIYEIMYDLPWIMKSWSYLYNFFHEWCSNEWKSLMNSFYIIHISFLTYRCMLWTHNPNENNHQSLISPLLPGKILSHLALWCHHSWSLNSCQC